MHQGELNMHQPFSLSSESKNSVLTMDGVMMEGPEKMASLRLLNSLTYP